MNQSLGVSTLGGGDGKELLLAHPGCGQKENLNKKKKKNLRLPWYGPHSGHETINNISRREEGNFHPLLPSYQGYAAYLKGILQARR